MTTNPAPPQSTALASVAANQQLRNLFDSLPSLIAQVRDNKVAANTVVQLRMIIPKHRKYATDYLLSKGRPDPFINLPDVLNQDIDLPPHLQAVALEVSKSLAATAPPRTGSPATMPTSAASGNPAPSTGSTSNGPSKAPSPQIAKLPSAQNPGSLPPLNSASEAKPNPGAQSTGMNVDHKPAIGNEAPTNTQAAGQPVKRPPAMAPGGKYSWQEVFVMTEDQRKKWFEEEPEAEEAWMKIYAHAQRNRQSLKPGSGSASPAAGVVPSASAGLNPNPTAADILAKNPPPLPNLNLPPLRAGPTTEKPKPPVPVNVNIANPYAFLHMIKAAPAHLDPTTLKKSDVEFYLSLNDDQAKVLPQNQQQTRVWIRHHVSARKARIQEEEQKRRIAQQGVGGMGFKAPLPPGMSPGLGPSRITIQNLSQEIQKYKEKEGKSISLEAVKDLCKRAGTTWTPEIERAVERFCAPPVPPKTPREVLTEQVRELSLEVLGEKMDESVEKLFAGMAEEMYDETLRGACLATRVRGKDELQMTTKDMAFHLRHHHDVVTAGYGQDVVTAGIKRRTLHGFQPSVIKRIKSVNKAKETTV